MNEEHTHKSLSLIQEVFSPSAPIKQRDLFFGRIEQINKVYSAVYEQGQHAALFGERGVGKTSLVNIIYSVLPNITIVKVTCNRSDRYKSLWERALKKIEFTKTQTGLGFKAEEKKKTVQLSLLLPSKNDDIDSADVLHLFEKLENYLLITFDEFDSIADIETRKRFADTIKSLSDNSSTVSVLIVGIANSIDDLIGNHPSLERCLKQIKMPRMSKSELGQIIDNGLEKLLLKMNYKVRNKIIEYSSGFPHYTHLLAKYSAESTIKMGRTEIIEADFNYAVNQAIENAQQQLLTSFQKAIISSKGKSQFEDVLYALASAEADEFECSTGNQILTKINEHLKRGKTREAITYTLSELCKPGRGEIIERIGKGKNIKYMFKNPLMKAFVKLKAHQKRKSI